MIRKRNGCICENGGQQTRNELQFIKNAIGSGKLQRWRGIAMTRAMLKTREAVKQAKADGYNISEYAVRQWIKIGAVPVRKAGSSFLIFYPNLIRFLECTDSCDNPPP